MNVLEFPRFVRESNVFTEEELLQLAALDHLPSEEEVDAIRQLPDVQELSNAFIGDENTRNTHLQLRAQEYLNQGELLMAWKVLLL